MQNISPTRYLGSLVLDSAEPRPLAYRADESIRPAEPRLRETLLAKLNNGPLLRNLAGAIVLQLALLVSGTLSARLLGPTNRGYLAILATWPSTVCQLGAVGISLSATYYLASKRASGAEIVMLLRSSVAVQVVSLTFINATIILGYTLISGAPILLAACLSLLQVPFGLALDYGIALALGGRSHGFASGVRAVAPVLNAVGLGYLFLHGHATLTSVVVVLMTSAAVAGVVALRFGLAIALRMRPVTSLLQSVGRATAKREILNFGRRGYIGYLAPTDSFRVDQLVVGFLLSPRILGLYVVGAAFTTFTRVVALNIGLSATSEVATHPDAGTRRAIVKRTLSLASALIAAITISVGLGVIVVIPLLFGHVYASSVPIAECLLVASAMLSMKRVAVDLMRGAGELRLGTRAELINFGLFLVFCVPAGLLFGGMGVAVSLAVSAAFGSVYLYRAMRILHFL